VAVALSAFIFERDAVESMFPFGRRLSFAMAPAGRIPATRSDRVAIMLGACVSVLAIGAIAPRRAGDFSIESCLAIRIC
jgi:hypothetical protein